MSKGQKILIEMICSRTGVSPKVAEEALLSADNDVVEAIYILENVDHRKNNNPDFWKVMKSIWQTMNKVKLSVSNDKEKLISFPVIYGVAAASIFPIGTISVLYSLALGNHHLEIRRK